VLTQTIYFIFFGKIKKMECIMKRAYLIFVFLILILSLSAFQADVEFTDSWNKHGFSIEEQNDKNLNLNYSITEFYFEDILIDNENLTNIQLPGVFLPNDEGMPNLPGSGRYIALPQGAKAELRVIDYRIARYSDIDIAPAPRIPLDTETGPLEYNRNMDIYSRNANYPENFIQLSKPSKLRGVDVVMLGITPFQYNPVSKELIIYRDIKLEVTFSGGNGHYGEDRLRNRWWDPILKDAILNRSVLTEIDYNSRELSRDGAEYLIICPDDPTFLAWADSIKAFRQQQGILTMIVTTTDVGGNTVSAIETYVDYGYNNWSTPPAAVLLLGDYDTGTSGITSQIFTHPGPYPDFVSDNQFADVTGNDLPDIVFARITANDASQLEVMITKFLDYERNPPTDPNFYDHPITALGWQTERWFQICSEVVGGYLSNELGKSPVRINAVYDGDPTSDPWSTATNTSTVVNYFGPSGLDYIPATPGELGGFSGGTGTDVVNAINSGSFMLQHRDHGSYTGWGEPAFNSTSISSLTNVNNKLPFIFSINCQTGAFHRSSECFTEKFHRYTYSGQNSGALGVIAATEVSYSFVNDTYMWGVMDNLFPDFMPAETTTFPVNFVMPAFGNAAGKHFLYQSSWPYNTGSKQITYWLFHHHGDAFLNVYSEVPQDLIVSHAATLLTNNTSFSVTADDGSFIALTINGEIIGTADGTGSPVDIVILAQTPGTMLVTVTKQNYYRYSATVDVIAASGPYIVIDSYTVSSGGDDIIEAGETAYLTVTLKNNGTETATNTSMTLSETNAYITLIDSYESFGSIAASGSVTRTNAYNFTVSSSIPDNHPIHLDASISCDEDSWNYNIDLTASNPPDIIINPILFDETLQPDQTSSDNLNIGNTGGATLDYTVTLSETTRSPLLKDILNNVKDIIPGDETLKIPSGIIYTYTSRAYCSASGGCDEYISNILVGDINNSSTCSGYADYTSISTDMTIGIGYSFILTIGNPYTSDQGGLWIDWNQDEDFDDTGETITTGWSGTGPYSTTITPPEGALTGQTRMRARLTWNTTPTACGTHTYGEVEDYTVNVVSSGPEWLTLDGGHIVNGSIPQGNPDDTIAVGFDSTDLTDGVYTADIVISSNDPDESPTTVPVSLTVSSLFPPNEPINVTISISGSDLTISWDAVSGATSYKVYSSDDPYTGFVEDTSGSFAGESWSTSLINEKKFYYVTAVN